MVVVNVISLLLAMALNSKIRAKGFFRGAYFLPNILGSLVVGYILLPACGPVKPSRLVHILGNRLQARDIDDRVHGDGLPGASGNMTDYQDHYYPSEMSVDALLQTFLIEKDVDAFLADFDRNWQRYNRDIIRMVQEYAPCSWRWPARRIRS